ncbi:MAG: sigma-70 family RNA polymerase sigma factor [Lachnospiraceae bacterium]|nr:sigma-70 family RNA polymerase sigma factor [Lachnospiraceae bacterium]
MMYLYAFEEFTPEEIAKILGIPRRRVYSLIGEARKELGRADHEKI